METQIVLDIDKMGLEEIKDLLKMLLQFCVDEHERITYTLNRILELEKEFFKYRDS